MTAFAKRTWVLQQGETYIQDLVAKTAQSNRITTAALRAILTERKFMN